MSESKENETSYTFLPAYKSPVEADRLDCLHDALTEYFGNRLSLAPLESFSPKTILEVGSGSGAWAIQAAEQFPSADVLAIDISPLPERPIPPNLQFKHVDLTQNLPFVDKSFDVIHARLVIMHLPDGKNILIRIANLLKPGGWIIVEDPDDNKMKDGNQMVGPGMSAFVQAWQNILHSKGAEPDIGSRLEEILTSTGIFEGVQVHKVSIPLSGRSENQAENCLGAAWKETMRKNIHYLPEKFSDRGITEELARQALTELEDPKYNLTTNMYFVCAKRLI